MNLELLQSAAAGFFAGVAVWLWGYYVGQKHAVAAVRAVMRRALE